MEMQAHRARSDNNHEDLDVEMPEGNDPNIASGQDYVKMRE